MTWSSPWRGSKGTSSSRTPPDASGCKYDFRPPFWLVFYGAHNGSQTFQVTNSDSEKDLGAPACRKPLCAAVLTEYLGLIPAGVLVRECRAGGLQMNETFLAAHMRFHPFNPSQLVFVACAIRVGSMHRCFDSPDQGLGRNLVGQRRGWWTVCFCHAHLRC